MLQWNHTLATFMWVSSAFVLAGGLLLRHFSLVPVILSYSTFAAVAIVSATSIFVFRGNRVAIHLGLVLSAAAIISSISSVSHLHAMFRILDGGLISVLDVIEILGFYVFPTLYIIYWIKRPHKRRMAESV